MPRSHDRTGGFHVLAVLLLKLLRHSSTMRQPSHEYRHTAAYHSHRSTRGSTIIQLGCAGCTENSTQLQCRHSADAHHHQACSPRACSLVASRLDTIQFASPGCHDSARNDLLTTAPSAPLGLLAMVLLVPSRSHGPSHHSLRSYSPLSWPPLQAHSLALVLIDQLIIHTPIVIHRTVTQPTHVVSPP